MEKKDKVIQLAKSGKGILSPRISLPASWIEKLGVTEDDKKVSTFQFSDGDILITKELKAKSEEINNKLKVEAYNFGSEAKTIFLKKNKKDRIYFYSANILKESKKNKNNVMYYILNMCLELNLGTKEFFLKMITGDKELIQALVLGLMS